MNESADSRTFGLAAFAGARITIVVPGLGAGGTEHVVNVVSNHWNGLGCKVTLITLEPPDARPYYDFDPRIAVVRLGVPPRRATKMRSSFLVLQRFQRLRAAIRRSRPDLVISFLTRTNVLTLLATIGFAAPVIVSERNNPTLQPLGPFWRWLQRCLYPRAFGLVTMTQGALDHFPARIRRNGWVIANFVDLPNGWQKRRGKNILTAVGRLTRQKGFDLLLEAFSKVAASHPEWKLVIWGEGDQRRSLEALRDALGLQERVEMPGLTKRPGLWIENADVFVLSSRYEGWGIVLLEAMAAGLPVVSYECDWGPRAMITHGSDGILVPREDVEALAESLERVMADRDLRERLGARAEASAKKYMPEQILAKWDGLVSCALKRASKVHLPVPDNVV
ncbi:glycosyltransferase family 4 protein [Sinorhizobium terangae]|uniref:Glycosyltransferase n=1 Tax=Sinorhizobium terangae TaxID=110322 RepID=A0A6N7LDH2_SINTE|nr:glycosyltransferase family 4 protein [Sinorhizobium terangae]MBB4186305.1 glycosyltransferase involved in cell wall biosynthesis [Sinorhizobium terangae]MQX15913.1 glycosyltransferase [Sinorhizobium terangae]WFU51056.1 glycosyltransferase family 4 protein [Sinorhizobium terangae]